MHSATALRDERLSRRRPAIPVAVAGQLRLLLTAGVLAVAAALITADVLSGGVLRRLDQDVDAWNIDARWPELRPVARVLVILGQRGPVAVVVALVVAYVVWRTRSWRPLVLPAAAITLLNLVVGTMKIAIGRTAPYDGRDELFAGGTLYPSGHSANSVLLWGALAVVLVTSGLVRRRWPLVTSIAAVAVIVGVASVFRDTHWVTDVLAGWLIGGALLAVLVAGARLWTQVQAVDEPAHEPNVVAPPPAEAGPSGPGAAGRPRPMPRPYPVAEGPEAPASHPERLVAGARR